MGSHGFGVLSLFSSFLFNYFPDRLANIIASQINQTKGSDRKMWLEVWEEKAVIPLCSAGSYQIRFISSCRTSELQCYRHRLVRQLLQGAEWELCPCLRRREPADVTHTGCWMAAPPPVLFLPLLYYFSHKEFLLQLIFLNKLSVLLMLSPAALGTVALVHLALSVQENMSVRP